MTSGLAIYKWKKGLPTAKNNTNVGKSTRSGRRITRVALDYWTGPERPAPIPPSDRPPKLGSLASPRQTADVAYDADRCQGRAEVVTVRGKVQVRDGAFVGAADHGRMLRREPTHGD